MCVQVGLRRAFALFSLHLGLCGALAPVVMIPGLAGSVFKAKLNGVDNSNTHFWCAKHRDWFVTWLNLAELIPAQKDCLLARLQLKYDAENGTFSNAKGVEIDSNVDFGGSGGVAYVDPWLKAAMPYFGPMIDNFTATLGYQVGVDLHGAGYDWRLGPVGHMQKTAPGGFYEKLRDLVESTVEKNGARAHLVTHSLGGPTTLAFMQLQGPEWVSKYVETFIPLSAPWIGGAPMALTEVGGDNLGEPIPHDYLMPVQREAESGVFIMPFGEGWGNSTMVQTPSKNYTVKDLPAMLRDLNLNQTYDLYARLNASKLFAAQLNPPVCPTHVMYSTGVETRRSFVYDKDFSAKENDSAPQSITYGDGDGTVNIESLQWAEKMWSSAHETTFFTVSDVKHIGTVSHPEILDRIIRIVSGTVRFESSEVFV